MKKSKRGVTLVELVICCTIIVLLGGACSAVLASGSTIFNTSSQTANAQLDSDVLQNFMMNLVPSTDNVSQVTLAQAKTLNSGNCVFFDDENDNLFTVRVDGKSTSIRSIKKFEYGIVRAGDPDSETARAQFVYTATFTDGKFLKGGFVLSNMKYEDSMSGITGVLQGDENDKPFAFDIPSGS